MSTLVKVVEPVGLLDGTKAGKFREEISQLVENKAEVVLVDFKNVTFMDSSGLGALVLALKTVRASGGKMFICSVNDQIKMLFELTSMDRVFEIFANRSEFDKHLASL